MQHTLTINRLSEIDKVAEEFLNLVRGSNLIAFYAPMGAGKTTFTTAICRALGVESDAVSSPTFAIVNEYRTSVGDSIFHFDFYRITRNSEAMDIGLFDYLDSGCLCLMEWPENIEELLPDETLKVYIKVLDNGVRELSWSD
ncbi:MAG: tRNA (adenosine(37)-N6)-threonylcarbamoyltransferase complex ATPase subunit type 1 TsaE [Bacteroidales bacterium]|nr:tRNA (adenosine(37)-N6)-threonylcarbamoyltransferase complex ATPase subunit type 1 TsaE [Bacteroidales bacterium]